MNLLSIKITCGLALALGLLLGYEGWSHHLIKQGYQQTDKEWKAKNALADEQAKKLLAQKNEEVRIAQSGLQEVQSQIIAKSQELENAKIEYNRVRDLYVTGARRLSVATRPSQPTGQNQTTTAPAPETRELLPETSAIILDAARADSEHVRELNACIDLYNAARDVVNK